MSVRCELQNLTLGYQRRPAVHHVSTQIEAGSLTALMGPNGAGKSTLLKGIAGLLAPLDGDIARFGENGAEIAYLPQSSQIDRDFPISVEELIAYGNWARKKPNSRKTSKPLISQAIDKVGLSGFETRPISTLSGGQMQRVLFARIIVQDAPLILLDEPFNGVDSKTISDLIEVIKSWAEEGRTVIAVLHDAEFVAQHFPETLLLARNMVCHGATRDVLTKENLHQARNMAEAFDPHAHICAA